MNRLYADRNGIPIGNTKQDEAIRAVNKMIERDRQSKEHSSKILDYYVNMKMRYAR